MIWCLFDLPRKQKLNWFLIALSTKKYSIELVIVELINQMLNYNDAGQYFGLLE